MSSSEIAYEKIKILVKDFRANESKFLSPDYSEADVRKDFIDKFFFALGWDVYHDEQKNPYEQEVKIEKGVYVGKQQKRADYAFYLAPYFRDVKFYVEAKKPSRNLSNADDYFQSIRYGWNAGTQITFLTDFEELHILDCRIKPDISSILNYKIKQYHFSDYLNEEKFSEIYWLISREAVGENSLEKFAESLPKPMGIHAFGKGKAIKKGTHRGIYQSIDEAFLEELDEIRNSLAKAFKKANPHLESEPLTEMTQRMIDRLVFIRFLEDKQIEPDHYVSEFANSKSAWKDFKIASRKLDAKYNGVVFKKHSIDSDNFIEPDNKTFSLICEELAHINSPYNFDIIPIHILGSIYERFLGKVVIATDKRVRIEEKPEVRKAGGVYYTPQYIVNYIVDNTVGKLIEGKTPKEISSLSFADISCGSGSFLITVFDRLLEHHRKWYQDNPEQAKKDGCYFQDGKWVLSLKQKQKILTNNIYGVDLDHQAVEVTQLSLYLKLLEDETTATAQDTWVMFKEQLLPNLNNNIVCGNSLIGTDILESNLFNSVETRHPVKNTGQVASSLQEVDELKLKPMNFEDVFPEVMRQGGFDAIVGNPPYLAFHEGTKSEKSYFKIHFKTAQGKFDYYLLFVEKALRIIKTSGLFSYIMPNKFIHSNYGKGLKEIILNKKIEEIIDFHDLQIFKGATNYPCIITLTNKSENDKFSYKSVSQIHDSTFNYDENIIIQNKLTTSTWILTSNENNDLLKKIVDGKSKLEDHCHEITQGIRTGNLEVYYDNLRKRLDVTSEIERTLCVNIFTGKNIKRYTSYLDLKKDILLFPYQKNFRPIHLEDFPKAKKYLEQHKKELLERKDSGKIFKETSKQWFEYWDSKPITFTSPKIVFPDISSHNNFYLDKQGYPYLNTCYGIFLKDEGLYEIMLGLLNSRLIEYFVKKISPFLRGGFYRYKSSYMKQIPIPSIIKEENNASIQRLKNLTNQMLESKKQLANAKTENEKEYLEKKCSIIDKQIDQLVYELYGLTEEEIKIVEESL